MPGKIIFFIIDDDADDKVFFKRAVKKLDQLHECREAKDGWEALEQLNAATDLPDYIFLDMNMPQMDGKECLVQLKNDERLKSIPVIIYSTSFYNRDVEETTRLGANYYLCKPTDIQLLPGLIIEAINTIKAGLSK